MLLNLRWRVVRGLAAPALGAVFVVLSAHHGPARGVWKAAVILANCQHDQGHAIDVEFRFGDGLVRFVDGLKLKITDLFETANGFITVIARSEHYELSASIRENADIRFRRIPERFDQITCERLKRG